MRRVASRIRTDPKIAPYAAQTAHHSVGSDLPSHFYFRLCPPNVFIPFNSAPYTMKPIFNTTGVSQS